MRWRALALAGALALVFAVWSRRIVVMASPRAHVGAMSG